jgi:hypothetical protein
MPVRTGRARSARTSSSRTTWGSSAVRQGQAKELGYETMLPWETDPSMRDNKLGAAFAVICCDIPKVVFSRTLGARRNDPGFIVSRAVTRPSFSVTIHTCLAGRLLAFSHEEGGAEWAGSLT